MPLIYYTIVDPLLSFLSPLIEMDTGGHSSQAEVNQEDESSGEEGLEWDSPLDQGDIMNFSVTGIAEQLTRLDAVSGNYGR